MNDNRTIIIDPLSVTSLFLEIVHNDQIIGLRADLLLNLIIIITLLQIGM